MVVLAVCVFGWVSYQRLSLNLMPDISYPTLTVRTEYPGTAPEEVETLALPPFGAGIGHRPSPRQHQFHLQGRAVGHHTRI